MRSRYHPIEDGLWDDDKFDGLGDLPEAGFVERALFAYLCSNHRQRPSGIYRATDAQLSAGCRLPETEVRTYLASLALRGLIVRDGSWLYLPGYLRRQAHNPRVLGAVESQIKTCTSTVILTSFAGHYPLLHRMLPDGWQTVSQQLPDGPETVNRPCTQLDVSDAVPEQKELRGSIYQVKETDPSPAGAPDGRPGSGNTKGKKARAAEQAEYEQVRRQEWAMLTPEQREARIAMGMVPPATVA